jgi:hypothetical protein
MAGQVKFHKYSSGVLLRVGSSQWRNWGKREAWWWWLEVCELA